MKETNQKALELTCNISGQPKLVLQVFKLFLSTFCSLEIISYYPSQGKFSFFLFFSRRLRKLLKGQCLVGMSIEMSKFKHIYFQEKVGKKFKLH